MLVIRESGSDCTPANFSGRSGWNTVYQINLGWTLVVCKGLAAMPDEYRLSGAAGFVQDYGRGHFFT
jgi:hypothetical protein